jgi:hypothetical protein
MMSGTEKPKRFKSENQARKWAKNNKLKVRSVEYLKGGARIQAARGSGGLHVTLRVDDHQKANAKTKNLAVDK